MGKSPATGGQGPCHGPSQRLDVLHKLSTRLLRENQTVVLTEDLECVRDDQEPQTVPVSNKAK
ncbi:MAG: hypothetical protein F4162_05385 [Synechococcus sp. SB0676_bin_10]|uniref:Transposase n=1 Tax=Synechococcus sp. SB0676_bin_10 TaxID=2604869 RepID=A0A6B1F9K6_9SYNE|nr:hypothetical protein [Synechococcus sp. SB0676_bin_10]